MNADLTAEQYAAVKQAAKLIQSSRSGMVLTGAGISTPSGIPDFRSTDSGLWSRYNPMEVASLSAFRYAPEKFFQWLRPLVSKLFSAEPNSAHFAVTQLQDIGKIKTILTQNIDGLHQRAGSRHVLEIHGSFASLTCVSCFRKTETDERILNAFLNIGEIPHCKDCQSVLKPDVVLFEEQLPYQTWLEASSAARTCDLMLVAGSSLEVTPVAGLPLLVVERGAKLIIVNLTETYMDERADVVIRGDVADFLPLIVEEILRAEN